ncbi:unnamed protein product [Dracunculus medinensis]|uniref:Calponin-homology (CH) domain-containing protein n=1 Tax=Dracunculus medinensis TaxID=318479 RepID=A0A3P7PZS4_DRAME|nr:unnamed protein product [Dracunculus medinensis]
MQADLLIAVKVANDFKTEAQQEILKLSDKINELQKRRHSSRRNALLHWAKKIIANQYSQLDVTNFSSDWADGRALCFLFSAFFPKKIDIIGNLNAEKCVELALKTGQEVGVSVNLSVPDFVREDRPDWTIIMKYILNVYYIVSDLGKYTNM